MKIHGEYVPVRAEVVHLDAFSSHADYEEILGWLARLLRSTKALEILPR